jgi:hypothetical protein
VTDVILILLLGVGLAAALAWLAHALRDFRTDWSSQLSERNAEVDRRLVGVTETMDRRLGELDTPPFSSSFIRGRRRGSKRRPPNLSAKGAP